MCLFPAIFKHSEVNLGIRKRTLRALCSKLALFMVFMRSFAREELWIFGSEMVVFYLHKYVDKVMLTRKLGKAYVSKHY